MDKKKYDIISFHPRRHHNFEQAARIEKQFENFKHLTGMYYSPQWVKRVAKFNSKLSKQMQKRSYQFENPNLVDSYPYPEFRRLLQNKINPKKETDFLDLNNRFGKWVVDNYQAPKVCIGFDTSSRYVFQKWKNKSFLVLDLVIGIPQYRVKIENGENFTLSDLEKQPQKYRDLYKLYEDELELADLVLCGSDFVKQSCLEFGYPENKLKVINYGVDIERFENPNKNLKDRNKNIKFVFIGAVGYRKGATFLIDAWKQLIEKHPEINAELHFYGTVEIDVPKDIPSMIFHGQVKQTELIEDMKKADALVFPSLFEGSSYAIYQSMAMKLAPIVTPNSGSVIENNKSGIIINYGNPAPICEAMEKLIFEPEIRKEYAEAAFQQVKNYTWDEYGKKINSTLAEILSTEK